VLVIPHSFPYLTELDRASVMNCFDMDYVGYDEKIANEIEENLRDYLAYSFVELTPSASLSLLFIFKYLKVGLDDHVIISAINCWSVYNCVTLEGATPVVCDVRSDSDFRASYENFSKEITFRTKVIIITHMYGSLVEERVIKKIKTNYPQINIIEDFSTSLFSKKNYKLGRYSDFGIGSFGSTKPLTGGIGGVLCSQKKIFEPCYDQFQDKYIAFNMKISRLNQMLLLSQLKSFDNYQVLKKTLVDFYNKFVSIYLDDSNSIDLFRAITFQNPQKLIDKLVKVNIELDIRKSVQPNLAKELNIQLNNNSFYFKDYYSLPLNIKAYEILNDAGLLSNN
jgi:dTDP-4-amino-4,6-dideoxygalactose transaminase